MSLTFLYGSMPGRLLLRILTAPALSRTAGRFLSSPASRVFVPPFVRKNHIDLTQYEGAPYSSFNTFFTRPLKPGLRTFDSLREALCSPCDSRLTVYPLGPDTSFTVKNVTYTLSRLLKDPGLASTFAGGWALVFRLCVDDYHRYAWFDSGVPGIPVRIPGILHPVRPVATGSVPVYCENSREYVTLDSDRFGPSVQMEVGAMLVGKIANDSLPKHAARGMEKGHFEFGGSTVILLLRKDRAFIREDIRRSSQAGIETRVLLGEQIGRAASSSSR